MKHFLAMSLVAILLGGCDSTDAPADVTGPEVRRNAEFMPSDVTGPEVWGSADNVMHLRHLYFSEQPDLEALRAARAKGVTTIINLREPSELDWDEAGAAQTLGLNYVNIPISKKSATLDREALARIGAAVAATKGEPILLHCSSGNRAGAWLAVHLVEDHGLGEKESLAVARRAGLTRAGTQERVTTYLDNRKED